MSYGSLFHILGVETLKALSANVFLFGNGTIRLRSSLVLLSTCTKGGLTKRFLKYSGARLLIHLNVINSSLNIILDFISSQWSVLRAWLVLSNFPSQKQVWCTCFGYIEICWSEYLEGGIRLNLCNPYEMHSPSISNWQASLVSRGLTFFLIFRKFNMVIAHFIFMW